MTDDEAIAQSAGWIIDGEDRDDTEVLKVQRQKEQGKFYDDLTGQELDPTLVLKARQEELEYFESKAVWTRRRRAECLAKTGRAPISVRWVDVNKGDDVCPNYRSRLVARDIRRRGESPIFAPTPPLESLRTILSLAATDLEGKPKHDRCGTSPTRTQISVIDIARAYFCASTDPDDPTYVELPDEDEGHAQGMVGLLLKHMYGTKKAADGWHSEYSGTLIEMGFVAGAASACVFRHQSRNLSCSVHGDDLTTEGPKKQLDWFKAQLEQKYELKENARLGPGLEDDKEARVLNRLIRWTASGIEYEADPRQGEKLVKDLCLEGASSVGTPGVKPTSEQLEADEVLPERQQRPYRAVAARGNYLAADRPELQFSAKEVCRFMSKPTELSLRALKRLGRFIEGHRRLVYSYPWQTAEKIDIYSDTDWAGCQKTRKSTSGGCLLLGGHLIKSWSSTQASVALSSGEAEFYGVVKASGIGLGYQALLEDLGHVIPVRVWTDSSATIGICTRQGLGKLRHIDTNCLWVQQKVRDGSVELRKVRGEVNPADVFTKHLVGPDRIRDLLKLFNCEYKNGRAASAPKLREGVGADHSGLLAIQRDLYDDKELIDWHGYRYPKKFDEYMQEYVPEAYYHRPELLPHEHPDLDRMFPRAYAAPALDDGEIVVPDELERRGEAIGKQAVSVVEV